MTAIHYFAAITPQALSELFLSALPCFLWSVIPSAVEGSQHFARVGNKAKRPTIFKALALFTALIPLTGCSIATTTSTPPIPQPIPAMHGNVIGGEQPVTNAAMHLYAAGTSGYSATNLDLLTTPVFTDSNGGFNITGDYTCTAGQQMYIVATGGNPGSGINPNSGIMAALGDCANLSSTTQITMNEITTVGSVFALAPFMSGYNALGSSATNTTGLAHAFTSVRKLVDSSTGKPQGPALPAGATAPTANIITLADIIASCVNSQGGAAGDPSTCGKLFNLVTLPGGVHPTDTIGAALAIALNPTVNVSQLFNLLPSEPPFAPALTSAPADWTFAIKYKPTGLNHPTSAAVDANGNLWIVNSTGNSLTVLTQSGAPLPGSPFTGNGLNNPQNIAIDATGNAWITNSSNSQLSVFTASGSTFSGSPFSGNGLSSPTGIAIDAPGHVWVANPGNKSLSEFSLTGAPLQQISTGSATPSALAINPK